MMDNLRHLMAAYFHQDWWQEYDGSWRAAVEDFARRAPERVPALTEEISAWLNTQPSDKEVARRLDEMGNYRAVEDTPTAHVDWLADILALLASGRQALHTRGDLDRPDLEVSWDVMGRGGRNRQNS